MTLAQENLHYDGLLYPMMVIAAVAVIVFSLLGTASISGWMPNVLLSSDSTEVEVSRSSDIGTSETAHGAFGCAECGVINSVRESVRGIERRSADR